MFASSGVYNSETMNIVRDHGYCEGIMDSYKIAKLSALDNACLCPTVLLEYLAAKSQSYEVKELRTYLRLCPYSTRNLRCHMIK